MMNLDQAIAQCEQFANICEYHGLTASQEEFEQYATWLRELQERRKEPGKAQLSQEGTTKDAIDRQQAIDALARTAREKFNLSDEYNHYLAGLMDGELAIKELQTIQPEILACGNGELIAKPEPQWIPVSERVPEDYVDVLVWFEYFRYGDYNCMYATHGIGNYSKEYNSWAINHETGWKDLHVFAWMPLPEPYGKEDVQDE